MRKCLRYVLAFAAVLSAATSVFLVVLYSAAQHEPDFYRAALEAESERAEAGDELERQMLDLHNDLRQDGVWEAVFTDAHINAWLASDLPHKFPRLVPAGVRDPRVAIAPDQLQLACRYEGKRISTVASFAVRIHLTEEPNVVAVRFDKARAGALPLPLSDFLDHISAKARQSDLQLRWAQASGDPTALVTIPSEHKDYNDRCIFVDSIQLEPGRIRLRGRSECGEGRHHNVAHSELPLSVGSYQLSVISCQ